MRDFQHLKAAARWWREKITAPPWHEAEVESAIFDALLEEWLNRFENSASWEEDIPPIKLSAHYTLGSSRDAQTRINAWGFFLEKALEPVERKHPLKAPWEPTQMAVGYEQVTAWQGGKETTVWKREKGNNK